MNMYEESSVFSGRKGAAFAAVILLHVVFGAAFYSELAARIVKKLDPSPLNLLRVEPPEETIKPAPAMPLIDPTKIYVTPPEIPRLTLPSDPNVTVENAPPDPPKMIPQTPPQPSASTKVRMDPKHPLRIGEEYYPDASRRANEEGRCVVRVTVAVDGRIIAASIQTSSGFDRLDQACLNGVRGQHMLAATEDGTPIEQTILMPISWKLSDR